MTKTEAKRAFMAKEIQIYVDCSNFSLLREIVFKGEGSTHPFQEEKHLHKYLLRDGDTFRSNSIKFVNGAGVTTVPTVNLSDIVEDKIQPVAQIEKRFISFTLNVGEDTMCLDRKIHKLSTVELLAAYTLIEHQVKAEKEELINKH